MLTSLSRALIVFMILLTCTSSALEGTWRYQEARYGFSAYEVEYLYVFRNLEEGHGTATLTYSKPYGTKLTVPQRVQFLYQELNVLGASFLLIVYLPEKPGGQAEVEWYEITHSTEDCIFTNHRGTSAVFKRER